MSIEFPDNVQVKDLQKALELITNKIQEISGEEKWHSPVTGNLKSVGGDISAQLAEIAQ